MRPKNSVRAQRRWCPACTRTLLLPKTHSGIEVDVCPNCRGIWLDAGELEHILRRYRRTKAPSKVGERAGDIAGGIAGEAAGAVFEFIGELIGGILS